MTETEFTALLRRAERILTQDEVDARAKNHGTLARYGSRNDRHTPSDH